MAPRIAVVVGSTRPARISPRIAAWTRNTLAANSSLTYELLDLADVNLPLLDEPVKATLHQYTRDHTRAWSHTVEAFDGFVFVFPQYNWGYPAVLKNALDYLYSEWRDKPGSFVTYGTHGGNKAAEQISGVLHGLHMHVLDHVEAVITDQDVDADGQLFDTDATLRPTQPQLLRIEAQFREALFAT